MTGFRGDRRAVLQTNPPRGDASDRSRQAHRRSRPPRVVQVADEPGLIVPTDSSSAVLRCSRRDRDPSWPAPFHAPRADGRGPYHTFPFSTIAGSRDLPGPCDLIIIPVNPAGGWTDGALRHFASWTGVEYVGYLLGIRSGSTPQFHTSGKPAMRFASIAVAFAEHNAGRGSRCSAPGPSSWPRIATPRRPLRENPRSSSSPGSVTPPRR